MDAGGSGGYIGENVAPAHGLIVQPIAELRDDTAHILASPRWVSLDARGRIIVADRSDRDIKIYTGAGARSGTLGRVGSGPGEFRSLLSGEVFRDSVIAYDFATGTLTIFDLDDAGVRSYRFRPPPWQVRVVDDSLFLLIGHPAQGRRLLRMARPDGSIISEFFTLPKYFAEYPELVQHSVVFADARDGWVFAGLFGGDSIFVFDYSGRRVAAGPVDPVLPVTSFQTLAAENHGRMQHPDGSWIHHGTRVLVNVVAMANSEVALQVTEYDAKLGSDLLEGGTIIIARAHRGRLELRGRAELGWGLMGRDRMGRALMLRYSDSTAERHVIGRLALDSPSIATVGGAQ
jgi:hypothetical protein